MQRLFDEVWNGRRFEVIDELYAPDYVADYQPYSPAVHLRITGTQLGAWGRSRRRASPSTSRR